MLLLFGVFRCVQVVYRILPIIEMLCMGGIWVVSFVGIMCGDVWCGMWMGVVLVW